MNGRRVLVTRPQPGAERTARQLSEMGFEPLVLPLSRTVALDVPVIADIGSYDTLVVTSANAVVHAPQRVLAGLRGLPCRAVGERTGEAARAAGLDVIATDARDAFGLAAQVIGQSSAGARVLYLCGKVRNVDFEMRLASAGRAADAIETYDTLGVDYTDAEVGEAIDWNPIWGAVVYSAGGAERLSALAARERLAEFFHETRFFCLSQAIAAALGGSAPGRTVHAPVPSETALIEMLRRA